jgi:hypothetical protein
MSFSFGPSGGIQDPRILYLLAELTTLIKGNNSGGQGASASEVIQFIEKHKDITFVDELSQCIHTFKEVAEAISPLIQGLKITPESLPDDNSLPGDNWQEGSAEDMFENKNPDEPADWWKT